MKTIHFIFGVHNHQPVGNFDFVFEEAYRKAYLPFLETLEAHPRIRMMYHTSGPLLDWLEEKHPDYLDRVAALAAENRLEIMTGAHYEPILAVLPDRDKAGQIQMMTDWIKKRFKTRPKGMWMAERIWEPHLAKPLGENGVEFVTLDDYHFHSAGMNPDNLLGYYRTDEQGYSLSVFPISMRLRYLIPFAQPQEAVSYLRAKADESGENLLVMCDDGEKFGLWPGTHEWVHKKDWLRRFFEQLEAGMDEGWLELTTCSDFSADHAARSRVYLPCASYFEMSEWALPAQSGAEFGEIVDRLQAEKQLEPLKPYLKGGFWRNFIGKYDESNRMYRKSLWVSNQIARIESEVPTEQRKNRKLLQSARENLYRGQCNCAYWHGVFGGLYLPHLRHAVYRNLIAAEDLCNQVAAGAEDFTEIQGGDFSSDGAREILLRNRRIDTTLSPHRGGSMLELDFIPAQFNLLNTLKRQPESYHRKIARAEKNLKEGASIHNQVRSKEKGLEKLLVYDRHLRGALIDHFFSAQESPESLRKGSYYELGDFVESPYNAEIRPGSNASSVTLRRMGAVVDNQIDLKKVIRLSDDEAGLEINYRIVNISKFPLAILFAPEFNFAMLSGDAPDRYYQDDEGLDLQPLNSVGISEAVRRFSIFNEGDRLAVHFNFKQETEVWRYPVETVSQSEGGFERIYQSSCVLPVYRLKIEHRGVKEIKFKLLLEQLI